MLSCSALQVINQEGFFRQSKQLFPPEFHSSSVFRWVLRRGEEAILSSKSMKSQAICVLANSNGSSRKRNPRREIVMVDPLEAKQLAAKQMKQIKAKERFKRRRQIEAINGAWAMIGLTVGLVIEGQTGRGILSQGCYTGKWHRGSSTEG